MVRQIVVMRPKAPFTKEGAIKIDDWIRQLNDSFNNDGIYFIGLSEDMDIIPLLKEQEITNG